MEQEQLEDCVKGLIAKDERCQSAFYRHCYMEMMKICLRYHSNREDASATFNVAMLQVFKKIKDYRNEGPVMAWVRKIVVNSCLNALRSKTKYSPCEISDELVNKFQISPSVYTDLDSRVLMEIVQQLPNSTRLVFNLYIMEGYSHDMIADTLKISKGTSKWHLNNARTILKEQLQSKHTYENLHHG